MLFENFVISDLIKSFWHRGDYRAVYFYNESSGNEIDLLFEQAGKVVLVEVKSGKTLSKKQFKGIEDYKKTSAYDIASSFLVYGGNTGEVKYGTNVLTRAEVSKAAGFT